ncbi:PP218 [Orf virus]|uniref:PP218 n=1 Tax=Orf virus TaxID=10258 RepID=F1AX84_ORFV|nr:PP218 [Orf virus]
MATDRRSFYGVCRISIVGRGSDLGAVVTKTFPPRGAAFGGAVAAAAAQARAARFCGAVAEPAPVHDRVRDRGRAIRAHAGCVGAAHAAQHAPRAPLHGVEPPRDDGKEPAPAAHGEERALADRASERVVGAQQPRVQRAHVGLHEAVAEDDGLRAERVRHLLFGYNGVAHEGAHAAVPQHQAPSRKVQVRAERRAGGGDVQPRRKTRASCHGIEALRLFSVIAPRAATAAAA